MAAWYQFDVTLVGHEGAPTGAPDDMLLGDALRRCGVSARFAVWDDPAVDWAASPLTVIRSTWDYHRKAEQWLAWVGAASSVTSLLNPPSVLRWNTDKHYLADLSVRGIACVPTAFVESHGDATLAAIADERQWHDIIVKPAVAASAAGARRFKGGEIASNGEAHLLELLPRGAALVQPYMAAVELERERSLVFVAGRFVHAFTKPPFNTDATGGAIIAPHEPSASEMELAHATMAAAPGRLLYARTDIVPTSDGPMLMELELIEPDLGLRRCPAAYDALAEACAAFLKGERGLVDESDPSRN